MSWLDTVVVFFGLLAVVVLFVCAEGSARDAFERGQAAGYARGFRRGWDAALRSRAEAGSGAPPDETVF